MEENKNDELYCAFEPKVNNRFICYITDSTGVFIKSFVIFAIDRPKFQVTTDESGKRNYKWLPIKIELYDPIIPSSPQAIMSHLHRNEHFNISVKLLGPVGDVVEEWKIVNADIVSADFGSLDWRCDPKKERLETHSNNLIFYTKSCGDHLIITLMVEYEYAELVF